MRSDPSSVLYHSKDLTTWPRRPHFDFFRRFDEPFHGVTFRVEAGAAYDRCKQEGWSFFLYYLHCSMRAANAVESFRYRIAGDEVRVYDHVDAGPTIARPDGTFGFGYLPFHEDFADFCADAGARIAKTRAATTLEPKQGGPNMIHYSSLPWIDFTSLSHARIYGPGDSCPKISFGKLTTDPDGKRRMAVSVHVHHALVDGREVGAFSVRLEELLSC